MPIKSQETTTTFVSRDSLNRRIDARSVKSPKIEREGVGRGREREREREREIGEREIDR